MKSKPRVSKSKSKVPKLQKTDELVPPDGQYGWIIVISYAIANVKIILLTHALYLLKVLIFFYAFLYLIKNVFSKTEAFFSHLNLYQS